MHTAAEKPALIIGVALLALGVISGSSMAQAVAPAAKNAAANEQVIITNMPKHKSRVREFLKRLLGKASTAKAKLELTGSEVWTVPKGKFAWLEKRLEGLGSRVIRLRDNWNHILRRRKKPVVMTPTQQA